MNEKDVVNIVDFFPTHKNKVEMCWVIDEAFWRLNTPAQQIQKLVENLIGALKKSYSSLNDSYTLSLMQANRLINPLYLIVKDFNREDGGEL